MLDVAPQLRDTLTRGFNAGGKPWQHRSRAGGASIYVGSGLLALLRFADGASKGCKNAFLLRPAAACLRGTWHWVGRALINVGGGLAE
jgi:hypothetical protein